MQNVKSRLDAWRDAERRRDRLVPGSSEWHEAAADAETAAKMFRAELAQASVRYAEDALQARDPRLAQLGRQGSGAGESLADVLLSRTPHR